MPRAWFFRCWLAVGLLAQSLEAGDRVRVGYFPNVTHAPAIVGLEKGFFQSALGPDVAIETKVFNAGPAEIEALFAGELDLGYIGPGPAINGFVRSKGKALKVVSGAASGGASLIMRGDSAIQGAKDLAGKKIASPQIGNTQDIALRAYIRAAGLDTSDKGGAVTVVPVANPDILTLFSKGELDGAWVPEPWAAILRLKGKGRELVDERTLWPNGKFPTTVIVVATSFLDGHRELARGWLRGAAETTRWIAANDGEARKLVNQQIGLLTSREIAPEILQEAWPRLLFTDDPLPSTFEKLARDAKEMGFLPSSDIQGIFETGLAAKANLGP